MMLWSWNNKYTVNNTAVLEEKVLFVNVPKFIHDHKYNNKLTLTLLHTAYTVYNAIMNVPEMFQNVKGAKWLTVSLVYTITTIQFW